MRRRQSRVSRWSAGVAAAVACAMSIDAAVGLCAVPPSSGSGGRVEINERGERQTNMQAVEAARDRGAGRIVDKDTWTIDRIDAYQNRDYVPGRDFQLFDQERDRDLRIEKRDANARRAIARSRQPLDPAGQLDLGIVPPDITRPGANGGISAVTAQAYEDERTLESTDASLARMLKQLDEAEGRELQSLRGRLDKEGHGAEFDARAAKIRADYQKWRAEAKSQRLAERSRVLGARPATRLGAATQPAGNRR